MEEPKPVREVVQRIAFEMQEAGASKWQAMRVLKELDGISGGEQQLRKKAFEVMEKLNPDAAKTFSSFERMKVFTSKEKRERFDRGNIIKSLLRETKVSRAVAERIGGEVEDRIKDMKIYYLNTPLIREMVSFKLLEYGHEPVHRDYSRIGMPAFEVKKRLEEGAFDNPEVLREYTWLHAITGKARELHFDSIIHVFFPEDFCTKIFCAREFFEGGPEDAAVRAKRLDMICSLPATASAWNFSLAGAGAHGKKFAEKMQAAEKIFSLTGGRREAELALFADFEWRGLSPSKKKAVQAANSSLEMQSGNFGFYVSVDSRYQLKLLGMKNPGGLAIVNNYKERATIYPGLVACGGSRGILQLTGINLGKLAQISGDERVFFGSLDEALQTVTALSAQKRGLLFRRRSMEKWAVEESEACVSLSGLLRASRALNPQSPAKAAEEILSRVQKSGLLASQMGAEKSLSVFDAIEEPDATGQLLLGLSQRARKNYGFAYGAKNLREAETLLGDVPCVEISQSAPDGAGPEAK